MGNASEVNITRRALELWEQMTGADGALNTRLADPRIKAGYF